MMQVIIFPRGQLSAKDKERLTKAGICAVEADDPDKVCTVLPSSKLVTGDHLLMALLKGINCPSGYRPADIALEELQRLVEKQGKESGK